MYHKKEIHTLLENQITCKKCEISVDFVDVIWYRLTPTDDWICQECYFAKGGNSISSRHMVNLNYVDKVFARSQPSTLDA